MPSCRLHLGFVIYTWHTCATRMCFEAMYRNPNLVVPLPERALSPDQRTQVTVSAATSLFHWNLCSPGLVRAVPGRHVRGPEEPSSGIIRPCLPHFFPQDASMLLHRNMISYDGRSRKTCLQQQRSYKDVGLVQRL